MAAGEVCARVKIEILQEMTFELQAFEARMSITNGMPDTAIADLQVVVKFHDKDRNAVTATMVPDQAGPRFFYCLQEPEVMPSGVAGGAAQTVKWLIIPAPGLGGFGALGERYYVGATVQYKIDGVQESVDMEPDMITVHPMPDLALEYFLPKQVLGDDPHTPNLVEAPVELSAGALLATAGFTPLPDGSAYLDWNPGENQVGSYSVAIRASDGNAWDVKTLTLLVNAQLESDLEIWRDRHSGKETATEIIGNRTDPDSDGLPNLPEYALGVNPTVPDSEPTEIAVEEFTEPGELVTRHLTLTSFRRLIAQGFSYR